MNYCLIDESDPRDFLECEGDVLKTFFASSGFFDRRKCLETIRQNQNIEDSIKRKRNRYYNIVHFSAHGNYYRGSKNRLDYTTIVQRRTNKTDIEIFRPDSIVRTGLQADLFFSTNCCTFNPHFIDVLKHYGGISNFIAPVNSPSIGNTLVFAIMFYNQLFRTLKSNNRRINDQNIIDSFKLTRSTYRKYNSYEDYRLYNCAQNKVII